MQQNCKGYLDPKYLRKLICKKAFLYSAILLDLSIWFELREQNVKISPDGQKLENFSQNYRNCCNIC